MTMSNSKLAHYNNNEDDRVADDRKCMNGTSTPIAKKYYSNDDDSPLLRFTQDGYDDEVDVVWDWNSPKSTVNRVKKRHKIKTKSPEIKIPRHKHVPRFNVLKAELEELVSNLTGNVERSPPNRTKSSDSYKSDHSKSALEFDSSGFDGCNLSGLLGDDSLDEEMMKCTQRIEEQLIESPVKPKGPMVSIADDSFDVFFKKIRDEDIELLSQASSSGSIVCGQEAPSRSLSRSITRTISEPTGFCETDMPHECSPVKKFVFPRTKSMDCSDSWSNVRHAADTMAACSSKCSPEEIEKKRLEAKAKRELRQAHEIEQKRLRALETLKRNRLQRMRNSQNKNA